MLSLNIHGNISELNKTEVIAFLQTFDIICLIELKCAYPFAFPGFTVIRSLETRNRGGVAVLIKNHLHNLTRDITRNADQVWFTLLHHRFGALYIPPNDSPYFDPHSFSIIQEQTMTYSGKIVMIGDLNARIPDLSRFNNQQKLITYDVNPDIGSNSHGRTLTQLCKDLYLYPVNHMKYKDSAFTGGFTFRQGQTWKSQIDWVLSTESSICDILDFQIHRQIPIKTDHAALELKIFTGAPTLVSILERACLLQSYPEVLLPKKSRSPVSFYNIDKPVFTQVCPSPYTIGPVVATDIDMVCSQISNVLYDACKRASMNHLPPNAAPQDPSNRWQHLLDMKDPKTLWKAINWNGKVEHSLACTETPSDAEFKRHFELLLNPNDQEPLIIPHTDIYVPILDDPITPMELKTEIKKLKCGRAAGIDGVPPGILKVLSEEWITYLTYLFNVVFFNSYPVHWALSKVFTIYKKGPHKDTNNYRGISILAALAKLYDSILNRRFTLWFKPDAEQTGGQPGKGCPEQLVTLRLLIDTARKTKSSLYITFVDYVKAYDYVDRNTLLRKLATKGCGSKFLKALGMSLTATKNVIGSETFNSSRGVKQGSPTSCTLFTFYVNCTIEALREYGNDGFLGSLHSLLLMDDTIILATSRQAMEAKLIALREAADSINMVIHPTKSQFMTVSIPDERSFILDGVTIQNTSTYTYLGSLICNSPVHKQVEKHMLNAERHARKFVSFTMKNKEAPFKVKKQVWQSAVNGAILYGCESWLTDHLKSTSKSFLSSQKVLLGVRQQTCTDLVKLETGVGDAKSYIRDRQATFFRKLYARPDYNDSPIHFAIELAKETNSPMGRYIREMSLNATHTRNELSQIVTNVQQSETTRRKTYAEINPTGQLHPVYQASNIPEYTRVAFTRTRLGAHRLKVESGRWARIEWNSRTCICDGQTVQTEHHVLCTCPLTYHLRQQLPELDFSNIHAFMESNDNRLIALHCFNCLSYFET